MMAMKIDKNSAISLVTSMEASTKITILQYSLLQLTDILYEIYVSFIFRTNTHSLTDESLDDC